MQQHSNIPDFIIYHFWGNGNGTVGYSITPGKYGQNFKTFRSATNQAGLRLVNVERWSLKAGLRSRKKPHIFGILEPEPEPHEKKQAQEPEPLQKKIGSDGDKEQFLLLYKHANMKTKNR